MAGYLINKKHQDLSVVNIKMLDGYKFRPKNNGNYINVSEVTIVNHMMIDKILTMKFERTFKRLVAMAMRILNTNDEDTSDDEAQIVLDEAQLVREILVNRYEKFLSHEKEQLFLKKLRVIENELRMKQVAIKQKSDYLEMQQEKNVGRSR